jgi:hypothetical protein
MRKEFSKTINDVNFKVTQLGFEDGIELLSYITNLLGPALAKDNITFASFIGEIAKNVSASSLKEIIHKLAKTTRIERELGKWPILEPEVDLAGNYDLTFKWLSFALEVNFGDFFSKGGLLSEGLNFVSKNV